MTTSETCEDCGYVWDDVPSALVTARTLAGTKAIVELLRANPDLALRRPLPRRWSMVEYGAHVRDVMLTVRDRLVIGIVEDDPGFKPAYREERVDTGGCGRRTPRGVPSHAVPDGQPPTCGNVRPNMSACGEGCHGVRPSTRAQCASVRKQERRPARFDALLASTVCPCARTGR